MAVSLKKGQKVDLTKGNPGLKHLLIGLGWDVNKYDGGGDFDLDASAFLLNKDGKVTGDSDFVFYGNLKHASGAVVHQGDNLTGEGEGDDEQIKVDLSLVPDTINKIRQCAARLAGQPVVVRTEAKTNGSGTLNEDKLSALEKFGNVTFR